MSLIPVIFNDTTPAAPGTDVNVKWQTDGSGNLSAHVPASGGSDTPTGGTFHGLGHPNSGVSSPSNTNGTMYNMYPNQVGGTFSAHSTSSSSGVPPTWKLAASSGYCFWGSFDTFLSQATLQQIQYWGALGQTTTMRAWLGCAAGQGTTLEAADPACAMVAFRFDAAVDSNWQAYVSDSGGGSHTATDTAIAPDTDFHQFKITADGTGGFNFYIDKTLVANIPTGATGMPAANTALTTAMQIDSSGSAFMYVSSMQAWTIY